MADPTPNTQPTDDTVSPVDVTMPVPHYGNTSSLDALQSSLKDEAPYQGGENNPAVWGMLPSTVQHGTLRNILGTLGDAFLLAGGQKEEFAPAVQRQAQATALAGFQTNPRAAISRLMSTGTPDSLDAATKLQDNQNNADIHRDQLQQEQDYHQDTLDLRRDNQTATTNARNEGVLARRTPYVGAILSGAKDAADYAKRYAQVDAMAKGIDPSYGAEDFGAIDPTDWTAPTTQGITANQGLVSSDKAAQRGVSVSNNAATNRTRIQAAGISAGKPSMTATEAAILNKASATGIDSLNPAQRATYDKLTTLPKGSKTASGLHVTTTGATQQQFHEGQVYTDAKGNKARYQNGKWIDIK